MATAFQLTKPATATLAFADAAGKVLTTPPKGSTIVWANSDDTFCTVKPATDAFGGLTAVVAPVDPTGAAEGSSVVSATTTNPDGTQVIATGAVAETDDVATVSMTFASNP